MDRIVTPNIDIPKDTERAFIRAMEFEVGQVVQVISTMETTSGPVHAAGMNEWVGKLAIIKEVSSHFCLLQNKDGGVFSFCYFSFLPVSITIADRYKLTLAENEEKARQEKEEAETPEEEERQNYMNEIDSKLIDMDVCTDGRFLVESGLSRLFELEKRVSELEEV